MIITKVSKLREILSIVATKMLQTARTHVAVTNVGFLGSLGSLRRNRQTAVGSRIASASPQQWATTASTLELESPLVIMDHALSTFAGDVAIAFSGAEDVALIEYAHLTGRPYRVFSLDTGRLNPETYQLFDAVEKHYGIKIEYTFPDAQEVMDLVRKKGMFSFYEVRRCTPPTDSIALRRFLSRTHAHGHGHAHAHAHGHALVRQDGHQECCRIRKVKPLRKQLTGLRAWITGQRKDQSPGTRQVGA